MLPGAVRLSGGKRRAAGFLARRGEFDGVPTRGADLDRFVCEALAECAVPFEDNSWVFFKGGDIQ